jgi:hypothetical protein
MVSNNLHPKPAFRRGAQPGNKNALGNAGNWYPRGDFVTRQLMTKLLAEPEYGAPQRAKLVRHLVKQLIRKALAGDKAAIKEIFNRVEGRALPSNAQEFDARYENR